MITAFKQYLSTLKLSPVSRKLYGSDVQKFISWSAIPSAVEGPSLDKLASPKTYSGYLDFLRSQATAPSMLKRTLASLRQFGTFLAHTYNIENPVLLHQPLTINHVKLFTDYLERDHLSPLTIKSYKSDITRYLHWASTHLAGTKLPKLLTEKNIGKYLNHLLQSGSIISSTIDRKEQSLARFATWYSDVYAPAHVADSSPGSVPKRNARLQAEQGSPAGEGTDPARMSLVPNLASASVRNFATLIILLLFISSLAIFAYRQFSREVTLTAAYPSSAVTPNRQLSFQGRLENAAGTPITSSTNFVFKLFTASSGGTELYTTGTCAITPDSDGVFNTQIGSTCGAAIAATVFSENSNVWLEVTVAAETLTPRQQIATVAYALNSETLQGFPLSSTISAIRNTIVPMNQYGEIIVGEQSPRLTGVSGTFQISAPALSIITATGTNGNITIAPDGTGQVNLTGNTTSTNFFNVSNAQLTTGSLITGTVANANTGFKLIDLLSGSSPTSKFSVTNAGQTYIAGLVGIGTTGPTGKLHVEGACVTGDTLIRRRRKKKKNGKDEEEWEEVPVTDIEPGDEIMSLDEQTGEFIVSQVRQKMNMGIQETYLLVTESGKQIRTTAKHPYLSRRSETKADLTLTKKSAFADNLVNLAGSLNGWIDTLKHNVSPSNQFVNLLNLGVDSPAEPTPNQLSQNQISNATWRKVSQLRPGMQIATVDGFETIISLQKYAREQVYDLEIDTTHNFVGNGIVAHNTTGKALAIFNETGDQNILTASASGTTVFNLARTGNITTSGDIAINGGDITSTGALTITPTGSGNSALVLPNDSIGPNEILSTGQTDEYCLTYEGTGTTWEWQSCAAAGGGSWSALTVPTANLSLAHAGYTTAFTFDSVTTADAFALSSSSLTTGTVLDLSSTSTAGGASGVSKVLDITRSGTNANASHTAYGLYSAVTNTGTTSTNVGGYFSASGATNNYGLLVANGNVGIGTTGPAYKLDVSGTINTGSGIGFSEPTSETGYRIKFVDNGGIANDMGIGIGGTAGFENLWINSRPGTSGTAGDIRFMFGTTGELVTFKATGNVGIGTTSPTSKLHVEGAVTGKALAIFNETGDQNILTASQSGIPVFNLARVSGTAANGTTFTPSATGNGVTQAATGSDTNIAYSLDAKGSGALNLNGTATGDVNLAGGYGGTGCTVTNSNGDLSCNGTITGTFAGTLPWSSLIAPTANLSLAHAGYTTAFTFDSVTTADAFALSSSSLTTGTVLDLSSTSTAGGLSGSSKVLDITRSGTNANASHTAYGLYSAVTNTGTTSTNVGGYFSASGATNNYGLLVANGNVGIGTTSPIGKLHVEGACVTGDTLIRRRRKKKKNGKDEEDWEEVPVTDIAPGDEIMSLDEQTGEFVVSQVRQKMNMGIQETYLLVTESGKQIRTTAKHPYLTLTKKSAFADFGGPTKVGSNLARHLCQTLSQNRDLSSFSKECGPSGICTRGTVDDKPGSLLKWAHTTNSVTNKSEELNPYLTLNTKKSAFADNLVNLTGLLTDWLDNLEKTISHPKQFVNLLNLGVDSPAEPTPNLLSQNQISNATWRKVSQLRPGMQIATVDGFETIISLTKFAREQVYDLEIDITHNFVGNGIVAHNTTGKALAIFNETGNQNILTASASGVTRMNLTTEGYVEAQRFADLANTTYYLDPAATGVGLALASGSITSAVSDSATAIGFTFNTTNTLSTQGSKLLSFQNLGTEKMYLDKDGNLYVSGTVLSGNGTSMLLTNKSGGTVANRSVVVLDTSNNTSFTTTTTPYSKAGFGVVVGVGLGVANDADGDGACDADDICMVAYGGSVNVTVKNATTAAKGDYLFTSDTAGSAVASAKQYDGLVGIVDDTTNSASGYLKMIFKVQPQVTAAAAIDKTTKHNEYWLYADQYAKVGEGSNTDTNLLQRGLSFDTFADSTKIDSTNTTVSYTPEVASGLLGGGRVGLIGGQTLATSTTDNDGQTYLGSNTVNDTYFYDRTRDSSPQVQVELGIDPNWYNGVTLSVATTSAQFSQNSVITQPNPNLSTSYNGSLVKVTGTDTTPRTIYITIKSPTTFDWTNYQGDAATGVTMTFGTAQALGTTGVSVTFTNARYNTGDVFKIASWFIEAESATRGAKQQFPERSNVIATASSVDIIDADTQKLWMRFSQGTSYAIGVDANNDPSSANMLNGKAYISTNGSAATGLYTLDFAHDAAFKQNATDWRLSDTALTGRNGTNTYNVINTSNILVNITANDVSAAVIPNQPTQEVTVSGWGYVVGDGVNSVISETVNLPYKFNTTPIILATTNGFKASAVPTSLASCTDYNPINTVETQDITQSNFLMAFQTSTGAATSASNYYCYTWTATGQVSPRQYVAVGTDGGFSVINETDQTVASSTEGTAGSSVKKIWITNNNALYFASNYNAAANNDAVSVKYGVAGSGGLNVAHDTRANWDANYQDTAQAAGGDLHFLDSGSTVDLNSLYITEGTSTVETGANTVYIGTDAGVSVIQEAKNNTYSTDGAEAANSSVKYYTKDYISEEMVGDIRGMWPLSANGALSLTDASVKANTLTNNGTATAVTGVRGAGVSLNGTTQYLSCTDANCGGTSKLDMTGANSVGAWIKRSTTGVSHYIFSKCTTTTCNNQFLIDSTDKVKFRWYTSGAFQGVTAGSNRSIDTNWHYIVGVYDGSTAKVYIDGELDTSVAETTSGTDDAGDFVIGADNNAASPNTFFSGSIDEPFVTATALTAGQIKNMYQVGYRALQSHGTTLGGGAADTNQQLGFISTGTNTVGAVGVDYNNQFMYVGTNSTTLGAVSKIDLNSDTNIKTYNSSANVPTGGPLLIDEDTKSLAVGYNLEAVGSAASGVKTMGVDNNATATSGNFIGKTITTAESFTQAYLWAQYTLDASDASNTIQVWASNDGGSNYYQCNLTNTDTSRSPSEYEYFCQFNTAGSSLKTKFVMARGSTKTNTWVARYGISWIDSSAVAGAANGSGLFTGSNASVANGSYIDVAHNQNSNDLVTNGWVYNTATSKWEQIDVNSNGGTGGTITYTDSSGLNPRSTPYIDGYTVHTFTTSGTFTPNGAGNVDYLVVAGGGGGVQGGGGAGGFRTATDFAVTAQGYTVTVGAGGAADTNGSDSVFSTITSTGGGKGGPINGNGVGGGSGGGGGGIYHSSTSGGTGISGQGNNGGSTGYREANTPSAGGGGAGAVGQNTVSDSQSGAGGAGSASSISGASVTYAGGGGGGNWTTGTAGAGGAGGGGGGAVGGATATNGTANTGGGGGGSGSGGTYGAGGSGIVIVRYLTNSLSAFKITQQDANTARLYNYSGATQNLRLDVITGGLGRNAGTVSLAPAAADVDSAASTNSIWINKTGSGGNLLKLQTSGTDQLTLSSAGLLYVAGNVGIGDTSPDHKLDVAGNIGLDASGYINWGDTDGTTGYGFRDNAGVIEFKNSAGTWTGIGSGSGSGSNWRITTGALSPLNDTLDLLVGNVATSSAKAGFINIGSGTPTATISGSVAGNALSLTGDGTISTSLNRSLLLNPNGGNVGIGVAAPVEKLEVNGYIVGQRFVDSASSSYYLDPAATGTSLSIEGNIVGNGAFYLSTGADATAVSIGTTGAGKLDAGTIDPPYTINGEKFATYMTSMTGVKEETTGVIATNDYVPGIGYRATLDFAGSLTGSDLWLFSKVSNLQNNLDKMVVLLSSSNNTKTWYEIDASAGLLYLYAQTPTTISYRLTAPRFDANSWANTRGDDSESLGFVINDENTWSAPESASLLSPIASDSPITITAPVVIRPTLQGSSLSDIPALIVDGTLDAATISARIAILTDIQADTITARNIVADTIEANHIIGLDAKIASLSAGLTDSEVETITDRIKARLALLTGNEPTAADIPVPQEATASQTSSEAGGEVGQTATSSATLASADIDFATINNYLAVIGQAVMTDLDVTANLYTNNLQSKDGLLALQPLGGIINLASGTLIVDSSGQVAINGDLTVSGKILAQSAELNSLSLGSELPSSSEPSALGNLLSIYNEHGVAVATINASGSANLAALTTQMITIASSSEASNSATPSGLLTGITTSNATAGESKLISPNTELTINSPYVTKNSLVYLTPTTNTDNKVLFVKSKTTCDTPQRSELSGSSDLCVPSFTVAIDQPAISDISFNWWVIQLEDKP